MSGANLVAYARWHVREALPRALSPSLFFIVIVGFPLAELASRDSLAATRVAGAVQEDISALYRNVLTITMTLGALLVASGFVAKDREGGHVRFLFSAPVVPWRFYLQRSLMGFALFCAVYTLIPVVFGWLVLPVAVVPVLASAAMYGFLLGSLALLAGAITRSDGAVVLGVSLVGFIVQQIVRVSDGRAPAWMTVIANSLPPIDTADQVRTAWLAGGSADSGQLTLVLVWSFLMLVTALVVIRRAPLVR